MNTMSMLDYQHKLRNYSTTYPTNTNKHVWEDKMNGLINIERILKGILHNLFTVLLALCDNPQWTCSLITSC